MVEGSEERRALQVVGGRAAARHGGRAREGDEEAADAAPLPRLGAEVWEEHLRWASRPREQVGGVQLYRPKRTSRRAMSAPMIVAGGAARPSARAGLSSPPTDGTKVIKKTVEPSMAPVMAPATSALNSTSKNSSNRSLSSGSTHSGGKMLTSTLCVPLASILSESDRGTSSVPTKSVSGTRSTAPPSESVCAAASSYAQPGPCGAASIVDAGRP